MAQIISGKELARQIRESTAAELGDNFGAPTLADIVFGDDESALLYATSKVKVAEKSGINVEIIHISNDIENDEAVSVLSAICSDSRYCAVILEEPIPENICKETLLSILPPEKDVDCATPENLGRILLGKPMFLPATPSAVVELLLFYGFPIEKQHIVVVGRSRAVGLPLANMLLMKSPRGNATVTVCHSATPNLASFTKTADILVVAAGVPALIEAEAVKSGAIVVDVGTNVVNDKVVGDVDFDSVVGIAGAISPVPGGVGPVTTAILLRNTKDAYNNIMAFAARV